MGDVEEIAHALAGAGGGALSMIVTYPLVTLSTLAQTTKKKKQAAGDDHASISPATQCKILDALTTNSTYLAAKDIIAEKGVLGLYSGLESALYGITLTNFIYYYFYELTSNVFLKANNLTVRKGKGLSTMQSIITGAIAGSITCVGSNPFWVANTRTMTRKKQSEDGTEVKGSTSTFGAILEIIEQDGPATLFAGVLPALVLVINPIIQYTIFEQVKNFVIAKNGKKSFTAVYAFFIGAFGKLIATSLTYPYITLKSRMHIKKKKIASEEKEIKLSMYQEIKKIIREEGFEGLYGGLTVKLVQSITTAAFLFYFKEELLTGSVKLVEILRLLRVKKQGVVA
ncbi:mitochondrial carrier [Suhomyces tanzawaensis NRRL Y-17324]|uniref:Mitochondrial thiamine pyrophosphate carrier 1 n=1 Tax=Suhomyces tanzawaensis NRRL Y-17324 TaxID=984487 RepID=A0A1E4SGD3_9ASCO|nr:mitochondrial carrier [Suhomyces tanzawaensis NRRL Y-17324]ODV78573.1 mitochondrial carrier [Suhomyces tanzawaensis NRRL Y-17324]